MEEFNRKRVLIAANPTSGASDRRSMVQELSRQLELHGLHAEVHSELTEFQRRAEQEYRAARLHAVVAAGGDGTVSAVVCRVSSEVPIGIFPLGTENLMAKQFGLVADPGLAAESIAVGRTCWMDAGMANGKLFLVIAGVGFDAKVVSDVHRKRRGHIRRWTYAWPILRAVFQYRFPKLCISFDRADLDPARHSEACLEERGKLDSAVVHEARWIFVSNLPRYANGLSVNPEADGSDGWLDVGTFEKGGLASGLWYLWNLWFGRHTRLKGFRHFRARRLHISCSERVPFQLDGDPGDDLPLEISVVPERIRLILPVKA